MQTYETERIVEEEIVVNAPGTPLYWTRLMDKSTDDKIGYALKCTDEDLDFCIFDRFYRPVKENDELREAINKKIDEISARVEHKTCRIYGINDASYGTAKVYLNFTG